MSEYQYYEFQAVDRPLTAKEMAELRSYSTRARITPTSFVNDYAWGNFKGNEDAWMEKYFDAFLYVANWGTHVLKLRLPVRLLDVATARPYCAGERALVREKGQKTILSFASEDEEGGEWIQGEEQLSSLISLRSDLARGDLRALYLGWLLCAQSGDLADDEVEPPVPAGLAQLSASLESLVEFLRVDTDLLAAAAIASPSLANTEPDPAAVREWLAQVPIAEKDGYLAQLMAGNEGALASELVQRMRRECRADRGVSEMVRKRRTVAELLRAGEEAAGERSRIAAEKAAKEKEQRAAPRHARGRSTSINLRARSPRCGRRSSTSSQPSCQRATIRCSGCSSIFAIWLRARMPPSSGGASRRSAPRMHASRRSSAGWTRRGCDRSAIRRARRKCFRAQPDMRFPPTRIFLAPRHRC